MVYLWVGAAGFLGACLRYVIGVLLYDADLYFPFSTLSVNLIGSFLLAWFTYQLVHKYAISSKLKAAIGTGFVGSFTTFSTLSVETVALFERGSLFLGILYISVSIAGGLLFSNLGYSIGKGRRRA
ncbi:chromosome condensation protein CcrB [Halobacillus andaensis]|uniref:Fluoride-specific ion channel FluC n=1 Tax=Halobacillus andaensis TaxID=1176239 RepID=A0A917EX25_HALAA|nr:fluoride efflux transporter CrcB [Halobacillus andaensis]MBP2004803.1 CrcB protein [Halobacillus andaensis]GGF18770.1 chromosome condensation protein CcrB [Halobacillus andaensis]